MGKKKEKKKYDDKNYEAYLKERESLIRESGTQSESYDKYLLTLSSGTFGLTITFLNSVLESIKPCTKWMISSAWSFLALTILLTLTSFLCSIKAYDKQIDIIEETMLNNKEARNNCWSSVTGVLNIISGLSFVIGIVFLLIFVSKNL
jgi:hypothetical protein